MCRAVDCVLKVVNVCPRSMAKKKRSIDSGRILSLKRLVDTKKMNGFERCNVPYSVSF